MEIMTVHVGNDFGIQPITRLMIEHGLKPNDLVRNSTEQLTHKMVNRAAKGRRLTLHIQRKVMNALNKATGKKYKLKDIFSY